jgi:hypothetical protein
MFIKLEITQRFFYFYQIDILKSINMLNINYEFQWRIDSLVLNSLVQKWGVIHWPKSL